ncbi:MAG: translation initiation factor IF-2 subunit gamma [Nanoarchaeota archaeon]|nr:translation initiation factor IF-2 subunit gamma [Nanoarchaeota archaeon]
MVKPSESNLGSVLNVGIVGHIDHGKTTLLYKLSGKWTDTHSEELKRGITIKLGYADISIYKDKDGYNILKKGDKIRDVSFIDAPGHEMLMATMLSGAALIDAALLVVAANEGIKPQTREHVMALQAKGIKNLIVIQNKIDLVDEEGAKKNYNSLKEFLKGKYDNALIIPVSAQQDVNIEEIWKALSELPEPDRDKNGDAIFLVARSFDINKPGTKPSDLHGAVLGGTLKNGSLKVGDEIEIKPGRLIKEANKYRYETIATKIISLFKGSKKVEELTPGGSMSIETGLDMTLAKGDALAGNVAGIKGKLPPLTQSLKLKYTLFPEVFGLNVKIKVEPLKPSELLMLSVNTSTTGGNIGSLKGDEFEVALKVPTVAFKGENVGIARNIQGHWRLVGYGKII